jgi:hypothetical protein
VGIWSWDKEGCDAAMGRGELCEGKGRWRVGPGTPGDVEGHIKQKYAGCEERGGGGSGGAGAARRQARVARRAARLAVRESRPESKQQNKLNYIKEGHI